MKKSVLIGIVVAAVVLVAGVILLSAHEHTEVIDAAVPATCTKWGLTEGKHCSECGEILVAQKTVAMLPHTEVVIPAVDATCTATGLTEGKECSVCETVTVDQRTTNIISCIISDWILDKEPTTTEDGKRHKECTMCGTKMTEETIPATGSSGLTYTVNDNGTSCTITGIGTCTDSHVVIPTVIDGYNVTAIATRAFYQCTTMTEITIPSSITNIGTQIFYKAENLHTVYYNSTYSSSLNNFMNIASIKKVVLGGKNIPSYVLYNCSNVETVEIISDVTHIGESAFAFCTSLTSVVMGDSVTSIGRLAFRGCSSLTSIEIPGSVTSIGSDAFWDCSSLTSIEIPNSVTSIGDGAFCGCDSLTSIEIPNSVTSIDRETFASCRLLASVVIPDSVTSIGWGAFNNCTSLTNIEIPDSVTSIGWGAFEDCTSLTSIVIPDSVTIIVWGAFKNCTSLTIYCEVESLPSGWDHDWNYSGRPVVWGYTGN